MRRKSSEYNQVEVEAEITQKFNEHKPACLGDLVRTNPPGGMQKVVNIYFDPTTGKYAMEREVSLEEKNA